MSVTVQSPVIVIGSTTTAMSVARIAAKSGYPVMCACERNGFPTFSRYFRPAETRSGKTWYGELGDTGYAMLDELVAGSGVLIPTADDAAHWCAALPDTLRQRYRTSSPPLDSIRDLQDKRSFSQLVDELGVPHPYTRVIDSEAALSGLRLTRDRPVFLKPTNSQLFVTRYNKKALWIESPEEAAEICRDLRSEGIEFVLQEYVPGGADDHYFIDGFRDRDGRIAAVTARRRLRIYPPSFGNSSYCESVELSVVNAAWGHLQRLLSYVRYRGIFSAEFKRDAEDGEFRILEVNTRPWVYIEFADDCGIDMVDLHVRDAVGADVPLIDGYRVGEGCVSLYSDILSVIESKPRPPIGGVLRQWTGGHLALFRWRDPMPAMRFLSERAGAFARKLGRRLRGRSRDQ